MCMTRHAPVTHATTMEAYVASLEATVAFIPTLIAKAMNTFITNAVSTTFGTNLSLHLESRLSIYFEQFCHELAFVERVRAS